MTKQEFILAIQDILKHQGDGAGEWFVIEQHLDALLASERERLGHACQKPSVAQCALLWEADHQRRALEALGLADEFPWGCDAIEHVAEALIAARAALNRYERIRLTQS